MNVNNSGLYIILLPVSDRQLFISKGEMLQESHFTNDLLFLNYNKSICSKLYNLISAVLRLLF